MLGIVGLVLILAVVAILIPDPRLRVPITGGLIGVVASAITLFGQYYLRRSDPLVWQIDAWSSSNDGVLNVTRDFVVRILNPRDAGTALWNVRVVFYENGKETLSMIPRLSVGNQALIEVIDLPSQETVMRKLRISFPANEVASIEKAENADRVKLVAMYPDGSVFEDDLEKWTAA